MKGLTVGAPVAVFRRCHEEGGGQLECCVRADSKGKQIQCEPLGFIITPRRWWRLKGAEEARNGQRSGGGRAWHGTGASRVITGEAETNTTEKCFKELERDPEK